MKNLLHLFWFVVGLVTPLIMRLLVFLLMLSLVAVGSAWWGFPKTIDMIASDWVIRAIRILPVEWEERLYIVFSVIAFFIILAGWVVLSFITVFIVKLIF